MPDTIDLRDLALAVSKELGWTAIPVSADRAKIAARISLCTGEVITIFGNSWTRDDRIHIRGEFPTTKDAVDCGPGYDQRPKITVARTRTPEQIAKDIQKRFLPKYLPLYTEALKRKKEIDAKREAAERGADRIAQACGGEVKEVGSESGVLLYGKEVYATFKSFDGKDWSADIRHISQHGALEIARVLKREAMEKARELVMVDTPGRGQICAACGEMKDASENAGYVEGWICGDCRESGRV